MDLQCWSSLSAATVGTLRSLPHSRRPALFAPSRLCSLCDRRSIWITVRESPVPFPRAFHDRFERLEFGLPAKFFLNFFGRRNQAWRIARPRRFFNDLDIRRGVFASGCDYSRDTRATASSEIVKFTPGRTESQDMGTSQIEDMNVIANTGAIRCFVIGAIHLDVGLLA